ncbi:MAG: hypothetical protein DRJ67_11820 [Thermoprotei archaeon]|nr:MAG: hypothetical protein DRJ67_11820 [Thermoprotei archaeon]
MRAALRAALTPLAQLRRWRLRWILGLAFGFAAGFVRHYFQWLIPLDLIEAALTSAFPQLRLGPLTAYHLLFTIPIFASVAAVTMPVAEGPAPLLAFEFLAWSAVIFSIEDASWFIAWMTKGGRWIRPGDWTCRIAGCLNLGATIPVYYLYSTGLLALTLALLKLWAAHRGKR